MKSNLDHRKLYRLPWTLTDNVISWLEPTKKCNLYCEGCYSANRGDHKTLEQVRQDLDVFERYRNTDAVSITGGDPLVHPEIVEIVRMVSERGWKPILNTNGLALTLPLLKELKKAGVKGFTFHIDSLQTRPGWKGKNEVELNELRLQYAEMVASVGGISTAFNATVYEKTLPYVPEVVEWGRKHIDKVHVLVFIAFRAAPPPGKFDHYSGAGKVTVGDLVYGLDRGQRLDISSNEVFEVIKSRFPEFEASAYLNGTQKPDSFKWLLTMRVGTSKRIYGYPGPRFVEIAQVWNHLWRGRYLGYLPPETMRRVKWMFPVAFFDRGLRAAAKRYLGDVLKNPLRIFRPLHMQSVMIIQPVDILPDGRQSMCDGCPDMTVWNGQLVWSCRLEEQLNFGCNLRMVPAQKKPEPAQQPVALESS